MQLLKKRPSPVLFQIMAMSMITRNCLYIQFLVDALKPKHTSLSKALPMYSSHQIFQIEFVTSDIL